MDKFNRRWNNSNNVNSKSYANQLKRMKVNEFLWYYQAHWISSFSQHQQPPTLSLEIKLAERHIQTNSIFSRGYYDHLSFASSHHHYLRSTANIRISKLISNSNWKFYHAKYFGEFITFTTWKVNSIKCGHTFLMCAYICWLNRNEKASARRN